MYEKELKRAERLLENEFGTEWKKIVQTLGVWDLTHCIGRDLTSFIAYPERGSGGSSNWQGNCSPEVIRQITQYVRECQTHRRKEDFLLLDPMCGSGTSGDVAADLGIQCVQYDLNPELPCGLGGWNALKDDVEDSADLVFLHPPYHSIIRYSGNMWGKPHADDLSRCDNYILFLRKTEQPDKPYYTLEVEPGGVIRQKRTEYDRQNKDIEEASEFLKEWQREIQKRITASDKKLADKSRQLRIESYAEMRKKKVKINGGLFQGKYLADVLEADLMEMPDTIEHAA